MLAREWAATQDTKTRHLVHTWQNTDVLEPADEAPWPLNPHLRARSPRGVSATPAWNRNRWDTKNDAAAWDSLGV